jgi:hypothetical protein
MCSVSQLGSGHSDHETSGNTVDDFDFAAVSGDELLTCKYGLISHAPSYPNNHCFNGDNSILYDCLLAVGSIHREFGWVLIWDLLI